MADKYLNRDSATGRVTEIEGTVTGGTVTQAGDIPALDPTGRLHVSLMPVGVAPDAYVGMAFENLNAASPFVYIRSDGQIANASAGVGGTEAIGFVIASHAAASEATVYFEGRATGLSGLTTNTRYYLSDTTPGGITNAPVSGTGKLHQFIGKAITATTISFEADDAIRLA